MSSLIADTPEQINAFRLLALKGALKLETKGMQMSRGVKASVIVRKTLKDAGYAASASKVNLLAEFEQYLRDIKVLVT